MHIILTVSEVARELVGHSLHSPKRLSRFLEDNQMKGKPSRRSQGPLLRPAKQQLSAEATSGAAAPTRRQSQPWRS